MSEYNVRETYKAAMCNVTGIVTKASIEGYVEYLIARVAELEAGWCEVSDRLCVCDMRTKLLGDGCSVCNPQFYIEILERQSREDSIELERLRAELAAILAAKEKGQ